MSIQLGISILFFLVVIVGLGFVVANLIGYSKKTGQEPGRIVMRIGINYTLSFLIGLQIFLNVVEAAIVGSLQDPGINSPARSSGHYLIALFGILGALTWVKFFRMMLAATVLKEGDEYAHWGKRFALFLVCALLMLVGLAALAGAPAANMYALANATHNSRQLHLFLTWVFDSRSEYLLALVEAGAPEKYSPWDGLAGVMVFSVILTITHLLVCIWEVLYALFLSLTKSDMTEAFERDLYADKIPKDDKNKGGKNKDEGDEGDEGDDENDEDDDKKNDHGKKKKPVEHALLEKLWDFMGMDDDAAEKWTKNVYPLFTKRPGETKQDNVEFASAISEIHRKVKHFTEKAKGPKGETADDIAKELKDVIFKRSKRKLTLPARKNG